MTDRGGGVLALVEAAYLVDHPHEAWALSVLKAAESAIRGGIGGFACAGEITALGTLRLDLGSLVSLGVPPENPRLIVEGLAQAPPEWVARSLDRLGGPAQCVLTSELDPTGVLSYRDRLADSGIADGVNLIAFDLNRRGFVISVGIPRGHRMSGDLRSSYRLDRAARIELKRAAMHILAAMRLRRRLGPEGGGAAGPSSASEAVLSREGRLLHAEGDAKLPAARSALATAAIAIEKARAVETGDRAQSLLTWKALVAARWTLVDSFERDGQRYLVARENRPEVRTQGLAGLSQTERLVVAYLARGCTTKQAAFNLGISDSTVRVHLMNAARLCGVKTREELLTLWSATEQSPDPANTNG